MLPAEFRYRQSKEKFQMLLSFKAYSPGNLFGNHNHFPLNKRIQNGEVI